MIRWQDVEVRDMSEYIETCLDRVRARESELTLDVRDATLEQIEEWTSRANARGFPVAGCRNWLLIRDLRGAT